MEYKSIYPTISSIIELAKKACNIPGVNKDLTDTEIAEVCKYLALFAPDTKYINGDVQYGAIGISLMLSIALYEFPNFYQRHELWQRN